MKSSLSFDEKTLTELRGFTEEGEQRATKIPLSEGDRAKIASVITR